jgi:small-conductance mechanosensitive channel
MNRPLFWLHGNPVTPIELLLAVAAAALVALAVVRLRRAAAKLFAAEGESPAASAAVTTVPVWLIIAVGVLLALDFLKLHLPSAALFAGLLSIAAAAALQPLLTAIANGILLRLEHPFSVGDRITVGKIEGDVKTIRLRSIVVRTPDNALVTIPNAYFAAAPIVNWSTGDRKLRLRIPVVVAHGSDLKKATIVLQRAVESSSRVVKSPAPRVLLTQSGKLGHRFEIWVWISGPGDRSWARNELYRAIDGELRKGNICFTDAPRTGGIGQPAEVVPEAFEPHSRETRGPRERKRRGGSDRHSAYVPEASTERRPPEPASSESVPPSPAPEREAPPEPPPAPAEPVSDVGAKSGGLPEEKPQTYGRSKRRTPRR